MQTTISETDMKLSMRRIARQACAGQYRYGGRGRTDIRRGVTTSTPVRFRNDSSAPELVGLPYWKTTFSNGAFSRTLYTASTMRIEVGCDWKGFLSTRQQIETIYSNDSH